MGSEIGAGSERANAHGWCDKSVRAAEREGFECLCDGRRDVLDRSPLRRVRGVGVVWSGLRVSGLLGCVGEQD